LKLRKSHRIELDIKESDLGENASKKIIEQLRKDGVISYKTPRLRDIPNMTIEDFSGKVGKGDHTETANYFIKTLDNFRNIKAGLYSQDEQDKARRNLLHLAVKLDDIGLIKYLETHFRGRFTQYLDKKDKNGMSPLAYALYQGNDEISIYLNEKMKNREIDTNEDIKKAFDSLTTAFSFQPADRKIKQTEFIRNYAAEQGLDVNRPGKVYGLKKLQTSKIDNSQGSDKDITPFIK